ncbi:MAG TPA: hypothetical protein VG452_02435 [Egibacteraceae bacterium]|nr:hypothetical protein [Egibacteraceae bacterium]
MSWALAILRDDPRDLARPAALDPLDRAAAGRVLGEDLHAGDTLAVEVLETVAEDGTLRWLTFGIGFDTTTTDMELARQRREYAQLLDRLADLADALDARLLDPQRRRSLERHELPSIAQALT